MPSIVTMEEVQNIINILMSSTPESSSYLENENKLCDIIKHKTFNHTAFHKQFIGIIHQRLSNQIELSEINQWELFHCLLRYYNFTNIGIEFACTELRRLILLQAITAPTNVSHLQKLALSLAIQCSKNEYAYFNKNDEIQSIDNINVLLEELASSHGSIEEITLLLTLTLMYKSPLELNCLDTIKISELRHSNKNLAKFIEDTLNQHTRELEIAKQHLSEITIKDETSVKVANMYKDNPYPRWTNSLVCMNTNKMPLEAFTCVENFPLFRAAAPTVKTILVAGCGTGKHPIQIALNYPWINITAIDISHRSIAYATMMADKLGVTNIKFKACDILDLTQWNEQFDMADSIGVIHHMKDPDAGLKAILSRLKDNGLVRLGLYSKSARKTIIKFRENYKQDRSTIDAAVIRSIRHEIIINHQDEGNQQLIKSDDFYSLSGCRDLILHEQETQYTIPEIKMLLEKNNLTFLGLGLPHSTLIPTIRQACGTNADIHDLDNWQKAETHSPYLFAKMYNFFAQKNN